MRRMLRCGKCRSYTLKEACQKCGIPTLAICPPKYSPEDKYGGYRRKAKSSFYKEQGLI